jgi:hypothetical protein
MTDSCPPVAHAFKVRTCQCRQHLWLDFLDEDGDAFATAICVASDVDDLVQALQKRKLELKCDAADPIGDCAGHA